MKLIALEEHVLPKDVAVAAGIDPRTLLDRADALNDLGEGRLKTMDEAGIDIQVLSAVGFPVQGLAPERATALSARLNDVMAAMVKAHPTRFRAFATLPMSDPKAAVKELRRTVEELGFVGTMIWGQTGGVFLDDPSVREVLATAEQLGVPIYLHPAPPPPSVREAYFAGLEPAVANMLAHGAWGWHAECGMHVLRMVVGLVFERFPGLQVIVGHMGEHLPFSLARADEWLTPLVGGLSRSVAETVREHVHVTISGYTTTPPLLCTLMVMGADRMMFSVDYPYADCAGTAAFLRDAPLSSTDRDKIAYSNAERLLRI